MNSRQFLLIWGIEIVSARVSVRIDANLGEVNLLMKKFKPVRDKIIMTGKAGMRCQIWPLEEKIKGVRKVIKNIMRDKIYELRDMRDKGNKRNRGRNMFPKP